MTTYRNPAIVIGGGSANGLGIARILGRLGIPVYCVTSNPHELMRYSKYCSYAAIVPRVEQDPTILISVLQQLADHFSPPGVLFPTTDTALLTVSAIVNDLRPYVTFIPDRELVETMVLKTRFYQSLRTHNIPHPATVNPPDISQETDIHKLSFPVFLRPAQSLLFSQTFGLKGFVAQNPDEVKKYLQLTRAHHMEMMIQEIIPGPTRNGFILRGYIDQYGRVLALMATQKIRQPSLFSDCTINRTIPLTSFSREKPTLVTYFQHIGYRGLFGAEFKRDPRDGVLKLLEVNARSLGGSYFAPHCGVNDLFIAYRDALGEDITPETQYVLDVYKINFLRDIPVVVRQLLQGQFAADGFRPYFRNHVAQHYSPDDPLPFFQALHQAISLNVVTRARVTGA